MPYPTSPTTAAAPIRPAVGTLAPAESASATLTTPATPPFRAAICTGSVREIFRVRLLSMAQPRQAAAMAAGAARLSGVPPPCQESTSGPRRDRTHSQRDAGADALAEEEPRQQDREDGLEVQEQRGRGGGGAGQPVHQETRGHHAAGQDREPEPEPLRAVQRGFARVPATEPAGHLDQEQPEAGSQIEESGEHQGIDAVEQQLGQRGAGAEQAAAETSAGPLAPERSRAAPAQRSSAPVSGYTPGAASCARAASRRDDARAAGTFRPGPTSPPSGPGVGRKGCRTITSLPVILLGFLLGMRHATDPGPRDRRGDHRDAPAEHVERRADRQPVGHRPHRHHHAGRRGHHPLRRRDPAAVGLAMEFSVALMLILLGDREPDRAASTRVTEALTPGAEPVAGPTPIRTPTTTTSTPTPTGTSPAPTGMRTTPTPLSRIDRAARRARRLPGRAPARRGRSSTGSRDRRRWRSWCSPPSAIPLWAVAYLLLFGVGTIVGMMLITVVDRAAVRLLGAVGSRWSTAISGSPPGS